VHFFFLFSSLFFQLLIHINRNTAQPKTNKSSQVHVVVDDAAAATAVAMAMYAMILTYTEN
jgi:hypothetical protein